MTKKIDPRSPRQRAKDAAYAALGPALIFRPLRYIKERSMESITDVKTGNTVRVPTKRFHEAVMLAAAGMGGHLQAMARGV